MGARVTGKDAVIARIMAAQRRFQVAIARGPSNPWFSLPLTMPQLKILIALRVNGPSGAHELAQMMGVSPATMTGIVDRLASAGHVTRREDPRDRRVRRIELTEAGTRLMDDMTVAGDEHHRRLLERLTLQELGIVERAMGIMQRALDTEETGAGGSPSSD
jgi:DNA-binding MarR family transcriptional regulator